MIHEPPYNIALERARVTIERFKEESKQFLFCNITQELLQRIIYLWKATIASLVHQEYLWERCLMMGIDVYNDNKVPHQVWIKPSGLWPQAFLEALQTYPIKKTKTEKPWTLQQFQDELEVNLFED